MPHPEYNTELSRGLRTIGFICATHCLLCCDPESQGLGPKMVKVKLNKQQNINSVPCLDKKVTGKVNVYRMTYSQTYQYKSPHPNYSLCKRSIGMHASSSIPDTPTSDRQRPQPPSLCQWLIVTPCQVFFLHNLFTRSSLSMLPH